MFIDIETTGFGRKYDQIIELAAIVYDDVTGETGEIFHDYARPKKPIPWAITELTGISDETVEDAGTEKDLMREFLEFVHIIMPDALVGHNGDAFDVPWIREKMFKYFLPWFNTPTAEAKKPTDYAHHQEVVGMFRSSHTLLTIDTLKIAKKEGAIEALLINGAKENPGWTTKTGRASYRQENIAAALGFIYDAHSAISDAQTLIKIYKHLFKTKDQKRKDAGF